MNNFQILLDALASSGVSFVVAELELIRKEAEKTSARDQC